MIGKLSAPPRRQRSLRTQMALGSALVALAAVAFVSLTSLAAVAISLNRFQRSQLAIEASQLATALGQNAAGATAVQPLAPGPGSVATGRRFGAGYIWLMTRGGQLAVSPARNDLEQASFARDADVIDPALQRALNGHTEEGALPGAGIPLLADRLYAVTPIHLGGQPSGAIIGALALSTPPRTERTGVFTFIAEFNTVEIGTALTAAVLAGIAAALFSRRLTRPLGRLTDATAQMAGGDYAARVHIVAPRELHALADSFNDMAAALERDVGELRRQEQLRRELVANVSHELATPLTAIEGFSEALLDGVVSDAARDETVRTIQREAERLHRLVDQLRQVARFESGTATLERAALPLAPLVMETLAVLAAEFEQRQITVRTDLTPDLPPVFADGDRVTEILLNLLDNALHHTPSGGIVEVSTASEAGTFVRLTVADSGPGIPPDQRERIFDRFYRMDASRSSATGGSGLGLAIVRALVEAHGGMVTAGEGPGGGASFSFTLPVAS